MVAKRTILLAVSAALLSAGTIVSASAQPNSSNSTSSVNGDWLPGRARITATIIAITPTILGTTTSATGIATKRNFGALSNGRPLLCAAAPAAIRRASSRKMLEIKYGALGSSAEASRN
jgi:hypothetical protein